MPTFSSGSRTPARIRRGRRTRSGACGDGSVGRDRMRVSHANKNSVDLENMPETAVPSSRDGHAGGAQGARRRDALLDVPGARVVDATRSARTSSPTGSASTPTPSGCISTGCGKPAWSRSRRCTAARSGGPQHVYALAAGCARARVRPAQLHAARRPARRPGGAHRRRRRRSGRRSAARWGVEAGRRTRSRSCAKALAGRARTPRIRPRVDR